MKKYCAHSIQTVGEASIFDHGMAWSPVAVVSPISSSSAAFTAG